MEYPIEFFQNININIMLEILSYPFFQKALIIGVFSGIIAGIIGTFIVIKKISFISGSIAHASFGGLGIAYFLGVNPVIGAMVFAVLSSLGIGVVSKKSKTHEDTIIGAMWSLGMAIGIVFIFLTPGYAGDLFSYLFGNILLTTSGDLYLVFALDVLVVLSVVVFYKWFVAIIFDEEFAEVTNVKVLPLYLFLLSLIAISVVVLIKVVGIILVIALLTLPAATAQLFSKKFIGIMTWAVIISIISTVSGIFVSYYLNLPSGPIIIFIVALVYVVSLAVKSKFIR